MWLYMYTLLHLECHLISISILNLPELFSTERVVRRGGGLGSRPKKIHGERLGDGV